MTQEEKDKLLKYLCMALPYGVICQSPTGYKFTLHQMNPNELTPFGKGVVFDFGKTYYIGDIKPYLRPISSMTEEERGEYYNVETNNSWERSSKRMDWLNEHHFDYRGLIDKGLAIKVTEDNNPYKDPYKD